MTPTPADKPDDASAVDPGAIDWDTLRRYVVVPKYNSPGSMPEQQGWQCLACKATWQSEEDEPVAHELYCSFAAVEALREREKQTLVMIADMLDGEMKSSRRAEAAEARGVGLAGALRDIGQSGPADRDGNDDAYAGWSWCYDTANAALAAMPAEALKRAKAVEDVITAVRGVFPFIEGKTLGVSKLFIALTKLDALGKEEE